MSPFKTLLVCLYAVVFLKHIAEAQDIYSSSYSTSGEQINAKLVRLDTLPHKSFTHYLIKKEGDPPSYSFGVETSENADGMFVNFVEFGERRTRNLFRGHNCSICDEYNVQISYSSGEVQTMCTGKNDLENAIFNGFGSAKVTITSKNMYSYSDSSSKSMVGPNGRQIPYDAVGFITFTLFSDCTVGRPDLKTCSDQNKIKCISAQLFCDGEVHCITELEPESKTPGLFNRTDPGGFDENNAHCTNDLRWKSTSRILIKLSSETIGMIVIGVFLGLYYIRLCITLGRVWLGGRHYDPLNNEESGIPLQIYITESAMARDGVCSDDTGAPMPRMSANEQGANTMPLLQQQPMNSLSVDKIDLPSCDKVGKNNGMRTNP